MPLREVMAEMGTNVGQKSADSGGMQAKREKRRQRQGSVRNTTGMPPYILPEDIGIKADAKDFKFVMSLLNTIANVVQLVV